MTYKVWVEADAWNNLGLFSNVRDAMELPNGNVKIVTECGDEETVPGADIIRLKKEN